MKVSDEGVVENDGVRRRHVVVFVDEEKMDLTKTENNNCLTDVQVNHSITRQ